MWTRHLWGMGIFWAVVRDILYSYSISYHFLGQILETTANVLLPLFVFHHGRIIKSICVVTYVNR